MSKIKLKQNFWIKYRNPIIYIVIFLCLFLLYIPYLMQLNLYSEKFKAEMRIDNVNQGFLVKTSGCRIPLLNPFDKSISKFLFEVKPFTCSNFLPLIESDLNSIYIDEQQLRFYNITNQDMLNCCYQPFWREDPKGEDNDNLYKYGKCNYFNSSAIISDEFVKVVCKVNNIEIYKDFHSFVPFKEQKEKKEKKFNVLAVGIDSVSRLHFLRQLPRTLEYLQKLNAIEMIGYNKVGDNTFPNLIPILTGQSVEELKKDCWPTEHSKFDNCSFIWDNYSKTGYLTAFGEDSSWMGAFNYVKRGFTKQPTDYYWRTFDYLAEQEIGHHKSLNTRLCLGPRPAFTVLLDYIQKFTINLKDKNYFGFFWGASLTHDFINYASIGDKYYKLFFKLLKENNIFNDTVLIFLSDHGMRWGAIRSTHQGQIEERLPFLYFIFPPWFREKFPSAITNIRRNAKRLTTPFDLHETLNDLQNSEVLLPDNIKQRSKDLYNKRGISLFLPIPENRTCSSAGISEHWCTCLNSVEIAKNNSVVLKAAQFIVDYINKLLVGYKSCAILKLDTIMDARVSTSDDYFKNNSPFHDYTVILKTTPGGALFEATVRCVNCDLEQFDLTGTISRLNLYGDQSACITNYQLKLYCYCGS